MSGAGAPDGVPDGSGLRLAIVAARWHEELAEALLSGAIEGAKEAGIPDPTVTRVSGALLNCRSSARSLRRNMTQSWHWAW